MEPYIGEFFGTMMLIILGDGAVATVLLDKSKGYQSGWIVITTGWFIAVMMGVFTAQALGSANADINPAISFARYWLQQYSLQTLLTLTAAQVIGAFMGAIIVWLSYLPHWKETHDELTKRVIFSTSPAIRHFICNFLTEFIATIILIFGVVVIFAKSSQGLAFSGLGPYLVGVLVWGIGLSLGGPTGYAINPARDFGPRLAHAILPIAGKGSSDWQYAWVPIVGPLLGSLVTVWGLRWLNLSL